jgi:hypothetical protein
MSKAVRFTASIPVSDIASRDSSQASSQAAKNGEFVSIAIFSGLGLLVSLIAVICGVQGAWY